MTGVTAMPAAEEPIVEITLAELDADPYPALARLRERTPAAWIPALDGWIVTRRDLCIEVMRDATRFTVDDPRFSTARVVGPSMLSLDGAEHRRHRDPFADGRFLASDHATVSRTGHPPDSPRRYRHVRREAADLPGL